MERQPIVMGGVPSPEVEAWMEVKAYVARMGDDLEVRIKQAETRAYKKAHEQARRDRIRVQKHGDANSKIAA